MPNLWWWLIKDKPWGLFTFSISRDFYRSKLHFYNQKKQTKSLISGGKKKSTPIKTQAPFWKGLHCSQGRNLHVWQGIAQINIIGREGRILVYFYYNIEYSKKFYGFIVRLGVKITKHNRARSGTHRLMLATKPTTERMPLLGSW